MATFIIYCISIAILLFYHFYFHLRLFQVKELPKSGLKKPISVIVIANNEFGNLQKLIPALLSQQYPEFEIILVDDRSYDETYDHFLAFSKQESKLKFLRIEEIPETASAKKFAITLAIKAAKYDMLFFIDGDCMPASEYWIHDLSIHLADKKEIVLGVSPYYKGKGFLSRIIQFETGFTAIKYLSFALAKMPYMGVGRNLGYAKHLFLNSKGFHPHYNVRGGDDDLFIQKIATPENTAICITPESFTYSYPKTTFKSWMDQKMRHYSVSKYYKRKFRTLLGMYHFAHLLSYILFFSLLFSQEFRLYSSVIFILRILVFSVLASRLLRKLASQVEWYLIPLFEFTYCLSVITFGLWGLKAKKIKWK